LLKENGLPDMHFHDLRHGAATVLLAAKVDLKVVSVLLGHSSVAITVDIYQSVLPEMKQEVVKRMDDVYGHLWEAQDGMVSQSVCEATWTQTLTHLWKSDCNGTWVECVRSWWLVLDASSDFMLSLLIRFSVIEHV
jgi:Phage integrase family